MKNYFSAKELEELHLTTLPSCKRLINIKATNENWPFRARKGKGGGREYNIDDLPSEVRAELLSLQQKNKESKAQEEREVAMASLLKLQDSQLQKASIREQIVQEYWRRSGKYLRLFVIFCPLVIFGMTLLVFWHITCQQWFLHTEIVNDAPPHQAEIIKNGM